MRPPPPPPPPRLSTAVPASASGISTAQVKKIRVIYHLLIHLFVARRRREIIPALPREISRGDLLLPLFLPLPREDDPWQLEWLVRKQKRLALSPSVRPTPSSLLMKLHLTPPPLPRHFYSHRRMALSAPFLAPPSVSFRLFMPLCKGIIRELSPFSPLGGRFILYNPLWL